MALEEGEEDLVDIEGESGDEGMDTDIWRGLKEMEDRGGSVASVQGRFLAELPVASWSTDHLASGSPKVDEGFLVGSSLLLMASHSEGHSKPGTPMTRNMSFQLPSDTYIPIAHRTRSISVADDADERVPPATTPGNVPIVQSRRPSTSGPHVRFHLEEPAVETRPPTPPKPVTTTSTTTKRKSSSRRKTSKAPKPWSEADSALFEESLAKHGPESWANIALDVGRPTAEVEAYYNKMNKAGPLLSSEHEIVHVEMAEEDDVDIDVEGDDGIIVAPVVRASKKVEVKVEEREEHRVVEATSEDQRAVQECKVDLSVITDEEKEACPEFFCGNKSKTPERYERIRAHIIKMWNEKRPMYLGKVAVRRELKDCGDVNAIGRVHTFLERRGAINFGVKRPKASIVSHKPKFGSVSHDAEVIDKKRVRRAPTRMIDELMGIEGRTRAHVSEEELTSEEIGRIAEQQRLLAHNQQYFAHDLTSEWRSLSLRLPPSKHARRFLSSRTPKNDTVDDGDLRLVACHRLKAGEAGPFSLVIESNALMLIDLHAHLSKNEIIGLLGGRYDTEKKILFVQASMACETLVDGDGMMRECELDPVSETQVRAQFDAAGYDVVGWYHSHPVFPPNPSLRDIENETTYQRLFALDNGEMPFVGAIVSPFDRSRPSDDSELTIFWSTGQYDTENDCIFAYALSYDVLAAETVDYLSMGNLLSRYAGRECRPKCNRIYRDMETKTVADKILSSVSRYMYVAEDEKTAVLNELRPLFDDSLTSSDIDGLIEQWKTRHAQPGV